MIGILVLLWCGVVAGPLFVLTFIIEGFLRSNYSSVRQPVSSLSQGPRGWIQQANFFISGALLVAYSWGLYVVLLPESSLWGPLLMFLYGAGLLGAGVFVTDHGIPKSVAQTYKHSISGMLHDLFSSVVFVSLSIDCFVFVRIFTSVGSSSWAAYSLLTGVCYAVGFFIFARGFSPKSTLAPIAGLLQRLTISLGALWVTLVALHFLGVF